MLRSIMMLFFAMVIVVGVMFLSSISWLLIETMNKDFGELSPERIEQYVNNCVKRNGHCLSSNVIGYSYGYNKRKEIIEVYCECANGDKNLSRL